MKQAFISYAREDVAVARIVEAALQRHGVATWSDRDLAVGSPWSQVIMKALDDADAVVVLVTSASLESEWVSHEWAAAMGKSKRVIPALAGGASFSDLPPLLETLQAIDLNTDRSRRRYRKPCRRS